MIVLSALYMLTGELVEQLMSAPSRMSLTIPVSAVSTISRPSARLPLTS